MPGLSWLTWLTWLTWLAGLTAGAGCATGAACAGRPTCAGCPALAAVAAIAAVATGSTGTTGAAIATIATLAAATAGRIEEDRAVDGVDVVDDAGVGDGHDGQRNRRCSQEHATGRTEASRMPTICSRVARLAVSLSFGVSHFSASYRADGPSLAGRLESSFGYVHNLLSWVIWESKSCRNGS